MKAIVGSSILVIVSILSLIFWYKRIDSHTTWIYGIYVILQVTIWIFVLFSLNNYWLYN